jgi:hypothetical protein
MGHIFIVIYDILTAIKIKITLFWDVTRCSSVDVYQSFEVTSCNQLVVIKFRPVSGKWLMRIQYFIFLYLVVSRGSSVDITTGYWLDGLDSIPERDRFFSSQRSNRLWVPASLLSDRCRGLSPRGVKLPKRETGYSPALVSRSRMVELYLHSPVRLHGIVLNWLSKGKLCLTLCLIGRQRRWLLMRLSPKSDLLHVWCLTDESLIKVSSENIVFKKQNFKKEDLLSDVSKLSCLVLS